MKNVTKLTVSALALCVGGLTAAPAMAQTVSGNVALTTDYLFRGVSFSGNEPAIQGGFDVEFDSGFYIGTWASSIETFTGSSDEIEMDIYAGYGGDLGSSGLSFDVYALAYTYPGANDFGDWWYPEFGGSISGEANVVGWTAGVAYSPETDNLSSDNFYAYGDLEVPFGMSPFYGMAHLGYEDGFFDNKIDWLIGVGAGVAGLDLSLAYVGFDDDNGDSDTVVFTIAKSL